MQHIYCPISHEIKWTKQWNEIWSVNGILQEKYFSSKMMPKMREEN